MFSFNDLLLTLPVVAWGLLIFRKEYNQIKNLAEYRLDSKSINRIFIQSSFFVLVHLSVEDRNVDLSNTIALLF